MRSRTWTALKTEAISRLTTACPALADRPSNLEALATIVALADATFSVESVAGTIEPRLVVSPLPKIDTLASELLAMIAEAVHDLAGHSHPMSAPALGAWVEDHGFFALSVALLSNEACGQNLTAVSDIVAGAIRVLSEQTISLGLAHMHHVLDRDLPTVDLHDRMWLTQSAAWLLAPETSGNPNRGEILKRRLQTMTRYGALSVTLREPDVTSAIDAGKPLAPLLMERHGLSAAELRALRDARRLKSAVEAPTDLSVAVQELKAHEVPLNEWPGSGKPGQSDAWQRSVWVTGRRQHIIRPDYFKPSAQGVQDAIAALHADLLRPLAAERARARGAMPNHNVESFALTLELGTAESDGTPRQRLLAALRRAIVGSRRPRAFQDAVGLWHRRVASLSALRHERRSDHPGWPALCAPWRSVCGRFEVVALASAADLVEEGRVLDHCVGGYYEICRRGDTQILSLREDGRRTATVELKLGSDPAVLTLQVGQFKAHRNSEPAPHLHDPVRAFLRDVRSGAHPTEVKRIARFRKRMRATWDGAWRGTELPITHAREVFPFYLPLLPRGTPDDFDGWCEQSGLAAAIDQAVDYVRARPRKG